MGFDKRAFAANLRAARRKRGLTQAELGKLVGLSADAIVKYESDTGYVPGMDKVLALCKVLKISPNQLSGWKQKVA